MNDPSGKAAITRAERNRMALDTSHLSTGLGAKTARGGVIGMSQQVLSMVIQLGNAAIMARLLEPSDYGLVAMALVVTGFVSLFTDLGLSTATIQRKAIDQDLVSGLFLINCAMGLAIMLAAWAAAPLAAWAYEDPRVQPLVMALAVTIPLSALGAQHGAILTRRMRWGLVRAQAVIGQLVSVAAGIVSAAVLDLGYWSLVVAAWAGALTGLALAWTFSGWRPGRVRDWSGVRTAVGFGANLTLFSFANWFTRNLDNALIGWRWGAAELGYYTRAYQLLMLPLNLVSGPVTAAVLPALSRLQDQPERWRARLLEAISALFFITCALTSAMLAASDEMILIVYGDRWAPVTDLFRVLLFAMFSQMITNLNGWVSISLGNTRRMAMYSLLFKAPLSLTLFAIGVSYGAIGVAVAFVAASFIALVPGVVVTTWKTPLRPLDVFKAAAFPVMAGLASFPVGWIISDLIEPSSMLSRSLGLLAAAGAALAIYTVLCTAAILWVPIYRPFRMRIRTILGTAFSRVKHSARRTTGLSP